MGKTALATNIAYNVAEFMSHDKSVDPKSRGVAFFSLEMSADQLAGRILSTVTQTPGHKMRTGELDNAEFTRIAAAVRELETIPLYIDDTPGLNINAIRTRARRLKRNKGLGLIVIDYIQLIMGTGSKKTEGNRVQELSEISRGLKILAKELNVPVIALSQLNRGVEQRDDKRPVMSDLRESGSIEQDADIVMFVFRENYYIQNEEPKQRSGETPEHLQNRMEEWQKRIRETANLGEVIIGKQRHGPTGTVKLFWNGEFAQFGNLVKEEYLPRPNRLSLFAVAATAAAAGVLAVTAGTVLDLHRITAVKCRTEDFSGIFMLRRIAGHNRVFSRLRFAFNVAAENCLLHFLQPLFLPSQQEHELCTGVLTSMSASHLNIFTTP